MGNYQTHERQGISRRKLLIYSISGLSLAAVGGAGVMALYDDYPALPADVSLLSAKEYRVLYSLLDSYFPAEAGKYPSVGEVDVVRHLATVLLGNIPASSRDDLQRVLGLIEYSPLLLIGSPSRFSALAPEKRAALLDSLMRSDNSFKQMIFSTFKKLAISAYYIHPFSWQAVGYDGPLKLRLGEAAPTPLGISTIAGGNPSSITPGRPRATVHSGDGLAASGLIQ